MRLTNLFLILLVIKNVSSDDQSSGVMGKIKAGFEIAGKFLGIDPSNSLAQMVSDTFSGKHSKPSSEEFDGKFHIFSGFLRLLGLDTKKISAIAVNAIIFIAQLISSTLSKPPPSQLTEARRVKDGTPYDWVLNNSNLAHILESAKGDDLPENVVGYIKDQALEEDTDCIQLLLCKASPLIWGMQRTVNSSHENVPKGKAALFANLPTLDEFADYGDTCEQKHPYCLIYY
ncbi:hypothetical protein PPYR_06985 [Photinus pyralis]|uniref:Uncharacterized protein n=2 Tax=Photinus pyralis TaxID=7054 RepID=A0A5N4AP36_PHOPY|nr:hypothetical protein PPYR_06985 [Photinus pyralis]